MKRGIHVFSIGALALPLFSDAGISCDSCEKTPPQEPQTAAEMIRDARKAYFAGDDLSGRDLDGDGCSNYVLNGWDANCDGLPDGQLTKGSDRGRFDLDLDGKADLVRETFTDTDGWKGVRDFLDVDRDGKAETRWTQVISPDGKQVRTSFFVVRKPDDHESRNWTVTEDMPLKQASGGQVETRFVGCADPERMQRNWDEMVNKGSRCLNELSPTLSQAFRNLLVKAQSINVDCDLKRSASAYTHGCNGLTDAKNCQIDISINPENLPKPENGSAAADAAYQETLFHELLHSLMRKGKNHDKSTTTNYEFGDEVYACANFCFEFRKFGQPKNLADCGSCLANVFPAGEAANRCQKAAQTLATPEQPLGPRPPKQSWTCWACDSEKGSYQHSKYDDQGACAASCPPHRGLACFDIYDKFCEPTDMVDLEQ